MHFRIHTMFNNDDFFITVYFRKYLKYIIKLYVKHFATKIEIAAIMAMDAIEVKSGTVFLPIVSFSIDTEEDVKYIEWTRNNKILLVTENNLPLNSFFLKKTERKK